MDIKQIREKIDSIDTDITKLFSKRMELSKEVAIYKSEHAVPIADRERERSILNKAADIAGEGMERYVKNFYTTIFDLSRSYQASVMSKGSTLSQEIKAALGDAAKPFPTRAVVACQGAEGAYAQKACDKIFSIADIVYFNSFGAVMSAVEKGLCKYGILPVENSSAGTVTAVYDLMEKHKFHIVRSVKLRISHVLLARNMVKLSKIKEIISHEQAISQCSAFLEKHPEIKVRVFENTASAAKYVAEAGRDDIAAIASADCTELYGLCVIEDDIQNSDNNYTRFICIAKEMEIYAGADKISLTIATQHSPGALYRVLSRFAALGVNLTKLESRPVPGKDFEFRFYFDFSASVYDPEIVSLLSEIEAETMQFVFLGCYSEIF